MSETKVIGRIKSLASPSTTKLTEGEMEVMRITLTRWGEDAYRLNVWSMDSGEREFSFKIRKRADFDPDPSEQCPDFYSYVEFFIPGHTQYVLYAEGRGASPPDELVPLYHFLRPYLDLDE